MNEQQIKELWDQTIESQFDCEWDELSEDGADQIERFAVLVIEATRSGRVE